MATQNPNAAGGLSPEEADRVAAMIRPSWEVDDEAPRPIGANEPVAPAGAKRTLLEGGSGSPVVAARAATTAPGVSEAAPVAPSPPEDTIIQGIPAIEIAGTLPGGSLDEGWSSGSDAAASAAPIAPAAGQVSPKATRMGVGPEEGEDLKATQVIHRSEPPKALAQTAPLESLESGAQETTKVIEVSPEVGKSTQVLPVPVSDGAATRPSEPAPRLGASSGQHQQAFQPAVQAAPRGPQPAGFSRVDDAIELPVEKGARNVALIAVAVLGLAAIVGGAVWFVGRNDEKPTPTAETAQPASTAPATAKDPLIPPPPPPEPAATTTAAATATPTAPPEPPKTATPEPPKTAVATAQPPEPPKTATAKPPVTSKPPTGGNKPPKGGVNKDVPF